MAEYHDLPDYDSLPVVEGMPKGCAWGVFDKDGKKDKFGCLNLLTPSVIREAYKEARDGVTISLNHTMDIIKIPTHRAETKHEVLEWNAATDPSCVHSKIRDDHVSFNTQTSSQWDGLLHFPHQATGLSYNGTKLDKEDLQKTCLEYDTDKELPSIDHWHDRGGVVGRGVLLDYRAYAEAKGIQYETCSRHVITISDLEAIAKHQGTELKHGDILLIRSGYAEDIAWLTGEQQMEKMIASKGGMIGVEGTEESAKVIAKVESYHDVGADSFPPKWFWNMHFAAVAGDSIGFEVYPPQKPDGSFGESSDLGECTGRNYRGDELLIVKVLHNYFLGLFGLNIGELWDLKKLGEYCAKAGRYSFLLTSTPMNIPGLVASPPNALALF